MRVQGSFLPLRWRAQAVAREAGSPRPPAGSASPVPLTPCKVVYETHPRVLRDSHAELPPYDGGYHLPAQTEHACLNDARTAAETQLFHGPAVIRRGGVEEWLEARIVAADTGEDLEDCVDPWGGWQERLRRGSQVRDPTERQAPLMLAAARAFRATGREVRLEQARRLFPYPPDYQRFCVPDVLVAPLAYAGELGGLVPVSRLPIAVEVQAKPSPADIRRRDRVRRRAGVVPVWLCLGRVPRTLPAGPDGVHAFAVGGGGLDPAGWQVTVGRRTLSLADFASAWIDGRIAWSARRGYWLSPAPPLS
jgi:hypothetical protein